MSLKDQIEQDINNVFFNLNEFGETHTIDGKSVVCILDSDTDGKFAGDIDDGVYVITKKLLVKPDDLVKEPVQGKMIVIDDDTYTCLSISREMGLLNITIIENST